MRDEAKYQHKKATLKTVEVQQGQFLLALKEDELNKARTELDSVKQDYHKWKQWIEQQHSRAIQEVHKFYAKERDDSNQHEIQMVDQILQSEQETKKLQDMVNGLVSPSHLTIFSLYLIEFLPDTSECKSSNGASEGTGKLSLVPFHDCLMAPQERRNDEIMIMRQWLAQESKRSASMQVSHRLTNPLVLYPLSTPRDAMFHCSHHR